MAHYRLGQDPHIIQAFKTARLASRLDEIDEVLFVVDRKDPDYHTMKEYDRFFDISGGEFYRPE